VSLKKQRATDEAAGRSTFLTWLAFAYPNFRPAPAATTKAVTVASR